MFPKKVVVAVNTSLPVDIGMHLRDINWKAIQELHFLHIFKVLNYGNGLSFNISFPFEQDREQLSLAVLKKLEDFSTLCLPYNFDGKVLHLCEFHPSVKEGINSYLEKHGIDLVIVFLRKKRNLWESSIVNFLNRHSFCSVLCLRNSL